MDNPASLVRRGAHAANLPVRIRFAPSAEYLRDEFVFVFCNIGCTLQPNWQMSPLYICGCDSQDHPHVMHIISDALTTATQDDAATIP